MKSIIKFFLFAIIATTIIPVSSCKKGANDPALPFSSRKGRLEGTWKLSANTYTVTDVSGNTTTTRDYTFDGTNQKVTTVMKVGNATPITTTNTYTYSETWEFTKDNTYTMTTVAGGQTDVESGSWAFAGKDKSAGLKNKEAIILHANKYVSGNSTTTTGATDNTVTIVFDELGKSQLVVTLNESFVQGTNNSKTTVGTNTYTK